MQLLANEAKEMAHTKHEISFGKSEENVTAEVSCYSKSLVLKGKTRNKVHRAPQRKGQSVRQRHKNHICKAHFLAKVSKSHSQSIFCREKLNKRIEKVISHQ